MFVGEGVYTKSTMEHISPGQERNIINILQHNLFIRQLFYINKQSVIKKCSFEEMKIRDIYK